MGGDVLKKSKSEALKDGINELPDEILSFTLSFLPVREAARTSILSCRWRYAWKTSRSFCSSLSIDPLNMRGGDYPEGMLGSYDKNYRYVDKTGLLKIERSKFIKWVDKMMQLDYHPVLDCFRLRYYLRKNHARHIDQFIENAMKKGVQNFDINLSSFCKWEIFPNAAFYAFPDGLFTEETGIQVKSLQLKSCIFGPFDFNFFGSLLDLKLDNVLLDQDKFHCFLLTCPSVKNLCLTNCSGLYKLKISGPHIQLKSLSVIHSVEIREIEINANYLARFEFNGRRTVFRIFKVPRLVHVILCIIDSNPSPMVQSITCEVSNLESLMLSFSPHKEYIVLNNQFANLKNLEVIQQMFRGSLWQYIPLILSAPYLSNFKLNFNFFPHLGSDMELESALNPEPEPNGFDSPHCYLKKMTLTGFGATNHEFEFVRYLLNNTAHLEEIAISFNFKWYHSEHGYKFSQRPKEKMPDENRVRQQIMNFLPRGVEFLIF